MQAHRMLVTIPQSRRAVIEFPETVPTGQVELIVLTSAGEEASPPKASPEALARWDRAAAELAADPRPFRNLTREERRARFAHLRGIGKGLLPSGEEFLREKRDEVELEERKLAR